MLTEIQVELVSLRRRDRERGMPNFDNPVPKVILRDLIARQIFNWCKSKKIAPEELGFDEDLYKTMTNEIASHFPLSKLSAEDFEFAMQMIRKESLARISHK